MWYKHAGTSLFHFVIDRQTYGQKGLDNTVRFITCSRTVKIVKWSGCSWNQSGRWAKIS